MSGTIQGTVTDTEANTLEDVQVTITDAATGSTEAETTTDANGDYSVTVAADTHDVEVVKVGYEYDEKRVTVADNETKTVDFSLPQLQPKVVGELSSVGKGVVGRSTASNGIPVGLWGEVESSDGYGLYTPDDVKIDGSVDIGEGLRGPVGSSAYMSSDFDLTNIDQKLPFDSLRADHRGEFDTSNHWFECAYDGTYAVEFGFTNFGTTSTGTVNVDLVIAEGSASSNPAGAQNLTLDFEPNGNDVAKSISRTIYGLRAGNRIYVRMSDSAENMTVQGISDDTFLSVRQVGGGGTFQSTGTASTSTSTTTSAEEEER